jgi:DNA invertase Pin-like site-specific DNA recombinase
MPRLQEINKIKNKGIVRNSKLKPEDVKVLKGMLEKGVKQNVIAKLFSISEMQVTRIKRGENWGKIKTAAS